jgi:Dolichyl-phosphate-mannose-protein mannosyltransferase
VSTPVGPVVGRTLTAESGRGQAPLASPRDLGAARASKMRVAVVATALCLAYALIHIATIVRSRQVWFDETFFASVADSLVRTGQFDLAISPLWLPGPVYLYGPVHFLMVGSLFELFGIGIVQNRLPGLLFGFALLGVAYSILRYERVRSSIALFTCILLALDPTFHQAIHSGRMDSTALFFILAGLLCLLKARDAVGRTAVWWCMVSGVASALGVLTTPRPGYMLIPMGLILLARWVRHRTVDGALQAIVWGAAFACVYGIWVMYAFGGVAEMLAYYAGFAQTYTGGSRVRLVHVPLLGTIGALLLLILWHQPRRMLNELVLYSIFAVVGFYFFVRSEPSFGALYASLMIPPAYLALGYLMSAWAEIAGAQSRTRLVWYGGFALLLLVNGSAFLSRTALEIAEWQRRDPTESDAVIARIVPPGSRVVGDDQFYFAALRSGSDFQYIERGGTLEERVPYHRDVYDFDFLISNRPTDEVILKAYLDGIPMRKVAQIGVPPTTNLAEAVVSIGRAAGLSNSLLSGYDGTIYARIR